MLGEIQQMRLLYIVLITAYMRLAISMAAKFKRYGAPMNDLVQEAGLGLMKAADKSLILIEV